MKSLETSFNIGKIHITPSLILAPMAEYSHYVLRSLVESYGGCGLFVSEMINARNVVHQKGFHRPIFKWNSRQRPFFFQLLGHEPENMEKAIMMLRELRDDSGNSPDGFDINMGCGAYWISRQGGGVALMKDVQRARDVVRACRKATDLPLTVKLRIGWTLDEHQLLSFVQMLESEGVDAITLHPRLAKEKFTNRARWDMVSLLKEHLSIPVIGNGDIISIKDINIRFTQTKCDGIMIGRLAIQKPWIFSSYVFSKELKPDLNEIMAKYFIMLCDHFPEQAAIIRFKQFMKFFSNNFKFGHQLKLSINSASTPRQMTNIIQEGRYSGKTFR